MQNRVYIIQADWDPEAKVWVAHSDDVPGLATGADTIEALLQKLRIVVPELLQENGIISKDRGRVQVPINLIAQRFEKVDHTA